MMVFEPTSKGAVKLHSVVPVATPDCPTFVDQFTHATPTLSLAVPLTMIEAAEVDVDVASRVTATALETCVEPLVATMVIVFKPVASGIPEMFHNADPAAVPE